VGFGLGL